MFSARKVFKLIFLITTALIFVISSARIPTFARGRGGKGRPPGWDKGDKEDWKSDVPPGQEESGPPGWEEGEKEGWSSDVPPGLAKQEGKWVPPGWSKGEKEGWKNSFPPGWDKLNKQEQKEWKQKLKAVKDSIKSKCKKLGYSDEEIGQLIDSLEISPRMGVPIEDVEEVVNSAIDKGLEGESIEKLLKAVSYGVDKEVEMNYLGKFVKEKLEEGLKGEDLAVEVYKEIQKRQGKKKDASGE